MISELCPDGVEYKTIGEIATDIFRGSGIKRDDITEYGIPCVRYGEIYTTYDIWFDKCISHVQLNKVQSPKYFEYGDILFAITGESIEDIAKSVAYVGHDKCLAGGDIVVVKHNQDPKYLSYALSTTNAQKQKSAGKIKSKVVHASVPSISGIVIPIPPLQVQHEIVRILDSFTEFTTKLITELTTERTARKKQYEYYSNSVLKIKDAPIFKIKDVVKSISSGKNKERNDEGTYPVYGSTGIISYTNTPVYHGKQILIARVGANAGYVHIADGDYDVSDNTLIVDVKDNISLMFLYYLLKEMRLNRFAKGGGQPLVTAGQIKEIEIAVPSQEEQSRIANVLTKFDRIINDISSGLPAEINARQKQYEHYRDKLLAFKKNEVSA